MIVKRLLKKYSNLSIVVKASIWFAAVTIIDKAISLLTQPFVNRILTTEQVGVYGVYTSWYSVISIIATFNLFCGVLEVYLTKYKQDKHNIAASLGILSLIISITFFGIVFCFVNPISNLLGLKPIYILLMAFNIVGEALIQFWAVPKRFDYSYKIYAVLIVGLFAIKSTLSICLTFWMPSDRVLGRILGLSVPTIICGIILFIFVLRNAKFKEITKYWTKGLKFNLPLIPHYLAVVILASSDRLMIGYLTNKIDVGLYTIAYTYASLSLIVFNAINLAYNPRSMQYVKDKKYKELETTTEFVLVFSIIFSTIMAYMAPEGLLLLGGEKYLDTLPIIPALTVGIFFSSFYFIFSNTKYVLIITLIGSLLNVGLNYLLIPVVGYKIAAYTTLIGYLVIAILHYVVGTLIVKQDVYNIKKILIYLGIYIMFSFMAISSYETNNWVRYIIVFFLICLLIYYFIKRKYLLFKKDTIK